MYTPNIEQTECASGYFIRAHTSTLWFGLALQDGCVLAMCTWSTEVRGLRHSFCLSPSQRIVGTGRVRGFVREMVL